jgi:hypothetical protein
MLAQKGNMGIKTRRFYADFKFVDASFQNCSLKILKKSFSAITFLWAFL